MGPIIQKGGVSKSIKDKDKNEDKKVTKHDKGLQNKTPKFYVEFERVRVRLFEKGWVRLSIHKACNRVLFKSFKEGGVSKSNKDKDN